MSQISVMMYHALSDRGDVPGADAHYTVEMARFREQIDLVRGCGKRIVSVRQALNQGMSVESVALTFDDGHISNWSAVEELVSRGGSADFFVNPGRVGSTNYLGWSQLREMVSAGMSIQSHGYSHRYLDELKLDEATNELRASKLEIEDRLGTPVTLLAPPGGRFTRQVREIAQRLGYEAMCVSVPGRLSAKVDVWSIPRFAVLSTTPMEQWRRWVNGDRHEVARQRARYAILFGFKQALGNRRYEALRKLLLRDAGTKGES